MKNKKKESETERLKKSIKKILDTPKGVRIMSLDCGSKIQKWLWQVQIALLYFKCPKCKKKNRGVNVVFAEKGKDNRYKLGCGCGLYQKEYDGLKPLSTGRKT
jgi:phage FluMu protein Com